MTNSHYNVAIIGSGIAGSTLAAILARHGISVVVFEAKQHPRFSIGESMILETSEMMRALADLYDVPEIAFFSSENFMDMAGTSHGIKRHFGYFHHVAGKSHDPKHTLQAVIPREPHGHEFHLYRQDTDYFMMTTAIGYGATVLQNTPVSDVVFKDGGVELMTKSGGISADYLVDAAGFRSPIAEKFNLRDRNQLTHSRALFTHMVNVALPPSDNGQQKQYDLPFPMSEGTLHHVFAGGWLWVIPFNNHSRSTNPLVSVGLLLDPRIHPQNNDLTPEEEFRQFIAQYPTIAAQFAAARAVRDWVRAPRIQYGSTQIVGDRWALLGHAAGFIDPLYSKGLYISLASVNVLAHMLLKAQSTRDYSRDTFQPLETVTQNYLRSNDRLVANSFKSWQHYKLWNVYSAQWLLGAYTELIKLNTMRAMAADRDAYIDMLLGLSLSGGGFDEYARVADQIDTLIEAVDPNDEAAVDQFFAQAREIYEPLDWMPQVFKDLLDGSTSLPRKKLHFSLLKRDEGFLGKGAYRQHFFGDHSAAEMMRVFVKEKIRYATPVLRYQHRRRMAKKLS